MTEGRHVDAELVRASGPGRETQERQLAVIGEHLILRAGGETVGRDAAFDERALGAGDGSVDDAARRRDAAEGEGTVFAPQLLRMQRAAQQFVGTHDFAAVRSVGTEVKSTVRTVYHYEGERDGDLISLRVCANGFLYNMARAMAGTVVYAAEGKFPPEEVANILANGDRKAAGPTVPPGGLYMTQLWYDDGEAVFHVG